MKSITVLMLALLTIATPAVSDTTLTFGTSEWEPYLSETLPNGGVAADITKAAFKKAGYEAQVQFMEWNRAIGLSKNGKLDGIVGCYHTRERAMNFGVSQPIGTVSLVFFKLKDAPIIYNRLEDLTPYKIGIIKGSAHTDAFDSATYLKKDSADKITHNIKKLLKGRIDLFLGSKLVTLDVINKSFARDGDTIAILDPPLKTNTLHLGISKKTVGYEKLLADFNTGLERIKADGTVAKIMKKHGF